ncbi:Polypyrimidine tract-binding protein 1 [Fasciola hepatica]|uniref:Polypyrimidine tract-binding protein 1 n=1 Tax=Fasciola hepatica TaxID=6192 RepID=A0A4E0R619_FASHE|nr:Polypyrimidine tract-binding protein 1 [Fasciola hepatica]
MASGVFSVSLTSKRKRDLSDGLVPRNGQMSMKMDPAEGKKSRMDHMDVTPSPVIHVRNVPSDVNEHEIALLAIPFGMIKSMVLSKKNNQALIEMHMIEDAVELIAYYSKCPVVLHGKNIVLQFSTHSHLELTSENNAIENAVKNANRIVQQDLNGALSGNPNSVLRIVISNIMGQQINHLILYKIFHRFGKILRVLIFLRMDQYHCLIEFQNHVQAFVAMLHLNGQNIYTGCCCLAVEFSKTRGPLEVRRQNDKCRDYLASPLTREELAAFHSSNTPSSSSGSMSSNSFGPSASFVSSLPNNAGLSNSSANPAIAELAAQLTMLAQQSGLALTPAAAAATASFMALTSQGAGGLPTSAGQNLSVAALGSPPSTINLGSSQPQFLNNSTIANISVDGASSSSVLIVSNLNEEKVYPDALFTLFGVYGDVMRVKIMFNKKDTALIQFADSQQALKALYYLNGQPLWGKNLKVAVSKFNVVQMPKEDTDVGLTKDFSSSPLHRFRKPNSKNFLNIYAPNHVLHLSNIPANITEDEIRRLFQSKGYDVSGFKFMMKDKKMALVQLSNVDLAMQALIELHNCQLNETSHLRISFSKMAI